MKRISATKSLILAAICLAAASVANAGPIATVDPATMTHGFMNVFNLPVSGTYPASAVGAYQFGSGWGLPDLVSAFSVSGATNVVTLSPNVINDPATYWYVGGGAAGSPGNKIMDAVLYSEAVVGTYANQSLTFTGVVYSNALLNASSTNQMGNAWTCVAFIKDFASDYSSFTVTNLSLTNTGPFSLTKLISADATRHTQFGFETLGPCVWASDPILPGLGTVQVGAVVFTVPVISVPPGAVKVVLGNTATFSVTASGTTGYQWKTNGVSLTEGAKYAGTQTSTLYVTNCQLSDATLYSVTVTGPGGSASATNSLTVIDPNKITINPADAWLGYINVDDLPGLGTFPANPPGPGYAPPPGGAWATADLCASFSGSQLSLSPNNIGDPTNFWYIPSGAPGNPGNKLMDANMYVETTGFFQGATMTFSGTTLNTNLLNPTHVNQQGNGWTCMAFVKDFAPDYSSSVITRLDLATNTTPDFHITYTTLNDLAGRHVQWGFETIGPDVWATDPILPGLGKVVVAPFPYFNVTASVSGANVSLSFPSATGYTYTVQYRNNVTDTTWTTLTTRSGTGSTITVTDPTGGHRFYRVVAN